jgi:ubiquinone/menaquinone biosynthesis C-methylase UbiE
MALRDNKIATAYYKWLSKVSLALFGPKLLKSLNEILFWKIVKVREGRLTNHHYEEFFTTFFDLTKDDYTDQVVMDIGCGPRGSLEWADNAKRRVGLDPLADKYVKMEGRNHDMEYIQSGAENMPFDTGSFDIVTSLNSLDHVDNLNECIQEIKRIVAPGGLFLMICDIHSYPTLAEPSNFGWEISKSFLPEFSIEFEKHFEGNNMYKSLRENIPYDHSNKKDRYGIVALKLKRN